MSKMLKKMTALMCVVAMLFVSLEFTGLAPLLSVQAAQVLGDSNKDGIVDVKDAVVMKKKLAGMDVEIDSNASEITGDAEFDVKDAVMIAKKLAGMKVTFVGGIIGGIRYAAKPEKITIMCDANVVTEVDGAEVFYEHLEKLLADYGAMGDIDLQFIRPEHSTYYDAVANTFVASNVPDVVFLNADYYELYARAGYLWNMASAYKDSNIMTSGNMIQMAGKYIESYKVGDGLYGMPAYRGNGCITYVKKSWLDKAGIAVADIEGKTLDFDQYYNMLKKLKTANEADYVLSPPGYISPEAPYTHYLPEFYQTAKYSFYKNYEGEYVDGFSELAMKDALKRIRMAVEDGLIDVEGISQSTAYAREKFHSDESGMITYWAGQWAETFKTNLEKRGLDGELIPIKPIAELGAYVERKGPVWCITSEADNPQGIYKYFIDTMLDGREIQMAWQYGVKGTHWDDKAETVVVGTKTYTYKEGEFHMLPKLSNPNSQLSKNHIDKTLALATMPNDPGAKDISDNIKNALDILSSPSVIATAVPPTGCVAEYTGDIMRARNQVIADVVSGTKTVDEGMAYYEAAVGQYVDLILEELNALED